MNPNVVAFLGTVATLSLFVSNGRDVLIMYRNGSTGEIPFLPFLATVVNTFFWASYGFLRQDSSIFLVNFIGTVLSAAYVLIYYRYSAVKDFVLKLIFLGAAFVLTVLTYLYVADAETRLIHLGFLCAILSIIMVAAPLVTVLEVVRLQDTSSISFPFCLVNFVASSLWFSYGLLIADSFVAIPNGINILIAGVQLSLFMLYRNAKTVAGPKGSDLQWSSVSKLSKSMFSGGQQQQDLELSEV